MNKENDMTNNEKEKLFIFPKESINPKSNNFYLLFTNIGESQKFLFNSKILSLDDKRKIKDVFINDWGSIITVINCDAVIGA